MAGISTRAVHAGERRTPSTVIPTSLPIYASSSFIAQTPEELDAIFSGEQPGYVYSRFANPTTTGFEQAVAALEEAETVVAFGSGMAALHAALLALEVRAGDAVLASRDLYGATTVLLNTMFQPFNVRIESVAMTDLSAFRDACAQVRPKVVLLETMSNPLLRVADVPEIINVAHQHGARVIVDNTFATPMLCRPLVWGADVVVHSVTKYLAGHGDVTAGVAAAGADLAGPLNTTLRLVGSVLSPFESWLAMRGLKTLPLRMRQHCANALAVATWLEQHPMVARVYYPALPSHPDHETATRLYQGAGFGGVVSFDLRQATRAAAMKFLGNVRLILPATTLGDVSSLVLYPAMSSHRGIAPQARLAAGIGDGLVRLSVGIEDVPDILEDLDQALHITAD